MREKIEVIVNIGEYEDVNDPFEYERLMRKKFKEAGFPENEGFIRRFDDPKDFGSYKYVWSED